ncbi:MAG TPA: Uma2 family endonuclease, partial [Gemmataceae bacterium]|nr:Uma2 family endonuclease [Gemmataceae bacterium]
MSRAVPSSSRPRRKHLTLYGISWRTYSRLLHAFAERSNIRLAYDRGELVMASPPKGLDGDGRFLGTLVVVLTEEIHLPIKRGGAATLRNRRKRRGIEADECFWIANAHRMAGRRRLDLRTDPPPDLAIEIDVTSSSLDRMGIYAALRVPEVWRLEGDKLSFHVLGQDGKYVPVAHSQAFPQIAPADLASFLMEGRKAGDENVVMRDFREWIR